MIVNNFLIPILIVLIQSKYKFTSYFVNTVEVIYVSSEIRILSVTEEPHMSYFMS